MTSLFRIPVTVATTKRLLGGNTLSQVRNAGAGPTRPPGEGGLPFPPGPKQMQQIRNWVATSGMFGAASFVGLVYFTDWRIVTDWIPFYNGKYKDDE